MLTSHFRYTRVIYFIWENHYIHPAFFNLIRELFCVVHLIAEVVSNALLDATSKLFPDKSDNGINPELSK